MSSLPSHITSLTADYEAIERAIRETSRGRWFLNSFLERNRSAETRILLAAIGKLEAAMRDNGRILQEPPAFDALMAIRDAFDQARGDMAHLARIERGPAAEFPSRRFAFETIPADIAAETRAIRDCAGSIQSAAYALQAAGVFQGVARQIADSADAIEHACANQEIALARASRMAALLSEIESELMTVYEDDILTLRLDDADEPANRNALELRRGQSCISEALVEEISAALFESRGKDEDHNGPSKV